MSRHTLIVAGRDLTGVASGLQWSTVDPGGCEAASFTVPDAALRPNLGDKVLIFVGAECVFEGRVEESGQTHSGESSSGRVTCTGQGAVLKDGTMSMVYVDRDMTKFEQSASLTRNATLISQGYAPNAMQNDLRPSSPTDGHGIWSITPGVMNKPVSEQLYDAGPNNKIAHVVLGYMALINLLTSETNLTVSMEQWTDRSRTSSQSTSELRTVAGTTDITWTPTTPQRYHIIKWFYNHTAAGTTGKEYGVRWQEMQLYGDHGLTRRDGSWYGERGLWPQDIVRHVLEYGQRFNTDFTLDYGPIAETTFRVLHAAYHEMGPYEKIIDDMATLMAYHWGVWPAPGLKGGVQPAQLHWVQRPTDATCVVARTDCEQVDFNETLSDRHNYFEIYYTDGAGGLEVASGSRATPRLPDGLTRVLSGNIGMASEDSAKAYGHALLALEDQHTRGAGPVTLPTYVQSRGGGRIASALLKAGLDRLRITDLPNAGPVNETDTRRFDTFRIKRTETTADDRTGALKTMVELDAGANLLETLNARIQHSLAAQGIGLGGGGA